MAGSCCLDELKQKFYEMYQTEGVQSGELVQFDNSNFRAPSLAHWNLMQMIWTRDKRYFMSLEGGKEIGQREALDEHKRDLDFALHEFYFREYIRPVISNRDVREKLSRENFEFALARARQYFNLKKARTESARASRRD